MGINRSLPVKTGGITEKNLMIRCKKRISDSDTPPELGINRSLPVKTGE